MDVLAYSYIAIDRGLSRGHELSTGREKNPMDKCCYSFCELCVVAGILLAFLVLHFVPAFCVTVGCLGGEGYEKSGIRELKPYSEPQLCPILHSIPY